MVKSRTNEGKVEDKTIEYLYLVIVKKMFYKPCFMCSFLGRRPSICLSAHTWLGMNKCPYAILAR